MLCMISDRLMYSDVSFDLFEVNGEVKDLVSRRPEDIRTEDYAKFVELKEKAGDIVTGQEQRIETGSASLIGWAGRVTARPRGMEGFYLAYDASFLGRIDSSGSMLIVGVRQ